MSPKSLVENRIREIRRNTRRKYSAEEKVRIVIEGLRGEVIIKLYYYIGINPYIIILFICTSAYLVLLVFFIKSFIKNGFPIFILPFIFFLGNPIINGFLVRKDVLIILFFVLTIYFSIKKSNLYLTFVNLILIIGLLIHELIGFFCFPILLLILISKNSIFYKTKNTSIKCIIVSISQLLPSIFTFLCVLYYNGSKIISKHIWNSWKYIVFPVQSEDNSQIPAAIDGLSWSLSRVLALAKTTLLTFQDSIYVPMVWLFIFILIYYLLTNIDRLNFKMLNYKPYKNFNKTNISNILIFQLFTIIPIIILGVDYGRWIFIWTTSSFAIIILVSEKELSVLFPKSISSISIKINNILDLLLSKSKGFLFLLYLIISFPYTYWNLNDSVSKSPLVLVLQFISIGISKILTFVKEFV